MPSDYATVSVQLNSSGLAGVRARLWVLIACWAYWLRLIDYYAARRFIVARLMPLLRYRIGGENKWRRFAAPTGEK